MTDCKKKCNNLSVNTHKSSPISQHLAQSFHSPKSPKYRHLLEMIKPIITHAFHDDPPRTTEDPNVEVIKSVLNTTEDIYNKLNDTKRKNDLEKIMSRGRSLLRPENDQSGFRASGQRTRVRVRDEDRNSLLKDFADALKTPEPEPKKIGKAPFSRLGEDGFEDVDHQLLAMEIKRLALTLRGYLQMRMKESIEYTEAGANLDDPLIQGKYYTDSVLTQMTLGMARLHRAVLRNHHHILMVIGNFAGNAGSDVSPGGINITEASNTENGVNEK